MNKEWTSEPAFSKIPIDEYVTETYRTEDVQLFMTTCVRNSLKFCSEMKIIQNLGKITDLGRSIQYRLLSQSFGFCLLPASKLSNIIIVNRVTKRVTAPAIQFCGF